MTHVATHAPDQLAFAMTDKDSTELMIQSGNILGKSWDLGNQVPNPFKTNILDPRAQVGALLN
jgi:23S rRNA maturation-related 3'-5' exoribonuclease YhaM